MTQFEVNFDDEGIHFHFADECPICHTDHASTNRYCSVHECKSDHDGIFACEHCGTTFKILSYVSFADLEAVIEVLSNKNDFIRDASRFLMAVEKCKMY